nr:hybrid sensor histidine kinase/response regulator [Rhodospirillaceae bacterium]
LLTLLSTAIKYNVHGGGVLYECDLDRDGAVRMLVSDSGIGIDPALRHRVFEPFARLGAEASKIEGVGIGLLLCKRIVEAMGGEIDYTSVARVGSTFWFTLPAPHGSTEESNSEIEQLFAD